MLEEYTGEGFIAALGLEFTAVGRDRVEARMPITERIMQPWGFVHGGATLTLLETVASVGGMASADLEHELPFGTEVHVRHRKSGRVVSIYGFATLDRSDPNPGRAGGVRQTWNVVARDDAGDVMSEGTVVVKVVPRANVPQG